jgi:thiol-disulfide isomerase/thioredoxin
MGRASNLRGASFVVCVLLACGGARTVTAKTSFAGWFEGAAGYEQAVRKQKATKRPMWVYVYTEWCPYCRRMNNELLASSSLQSALPNVVPVAINPETGSQERAIVDQFGANGYPSFFVIPAGSQQAQKISPYREVGKQWVMMSPQEFLQACRQAAQPPREKRPASRPPAQKPEQAPRAGPEQSLAAQVTLFLVSGEVIIGNLVGETVDEVTVGSTTGQLTIRREDIQAMER